MARKITQEWLGEREKKEKLVASNRRFLLIFVKAELTLKAVID